MGLKEKSIQDYQSRLNKIIEYIYSHIDIPLPLEVIAEQANMSPFHFHRVFTFLMGETPQNYQQRIRIEKIAHVLRQDISQSISDLAYTYGFSSLSSFSRTFRKYLGISATQFIQNPKAIFVNDGRYFDVNRQPTISAKQDILTFDYSELIIEKSVIEIKELTGYHVIYCRHIGAYHQIKTAYNKLIEWSIEHNLFDIENSRAITVFHDDPSITQINKVRQSACLTVTEDIEVNGEIGLMTIPKRKYAVGHFNIDESEFEKAWNTMCFWFFKNGYQQSEGNSFELYHKISQMSTTQNRFEIDICIPVQLL